jgi:hypothetical protein
MDFTIWADIQRMLATLDELIAREMATPPGAFHFRGAASRR